jgi:hypothetical protein
MQSFVLQQICAFHGKKRTTTVKTGHSAFRAAMEARTKPEKSFSG